MNGFIVPKNLTIAKKYFGLAFEQGIEAAQAGLEKIKAEEIAEGQNLQQKVKEYDFKGNYYWRLKDYTNAVKYYSFSAEYGNAT